VGLLDDLDGNGFLPFDAQTVHRIGEINMFALGGEWRIEKEQAVLTSEEGIIKLYFSANKVNIVAEGLDGPVTAEVFLDGELVSSSAGSHVNGGGVTIDEPGLYNLVDLGGNYGEHTLELRIQDAGLSAFTFTFG